MTNISNIIHRYSASNDRKLKSICSPLLKFNMPIFAYSFVEADGTFGYISPAVEYNEYFFSHNYHLDNPYFSHPALFRSGYVLSPCSFVEDAKRSLRNKYCAENYLLNVQSNGSRMDLFMYANTNFKFTSSSQYLEYLNLLNKFGIYFKSEAQDIIRKMKADGYNIREARRNKFENIAPIPLRNNDPNILSYLKEISKLSPKELKELEAFKGLKFTNREKDVIEQLLMGFYASEAARNLFLSNKTVEHYIDNIKSKLNCNSKWDLIKRLRSLEAIGIIF